MCPNNGSPFRCSDIGPYKLKAARKATSSSRRVGEMRLLACRRAAHSHEHVRARATFADKALDDAALGTRHQPPEAARRGTGCLRWAKGPRQSEEGSFRIESGGQLSPKGQRTALRNRKLTSG